MLRYRTCLRAAPGRCQAFVFTIGQLIITRCRRLHLTYNGGC